MSLTGSGSYGGSLGGVKANTIGLDVMRSPKHEGEWGSVIQHVHFVSESLCD